MKKIAFFTQNLDFGGVQKSVSTLANYLIDFYEVSIILAEDNKDINYTMNQKINIHMIETKKFDLTKDSIGEDIFGYRINALEALLSELEVDLVFSYEDYNNLILLSTKNTAKKAVSCRNCIEEKFVLSGHIHFLNCEFYMKKIKELYIKADLIVTVSQEIQNEIYLISNSTKIVTIYNGISENTKDMLPTEYKNYILNVARLVPQKGQRDLISAFKILENKITQNLVFVGDGKDNNELEHLIQTLNLKSRVFLVGFDNPYKYVKNCDLFVLPSYYEGFSNALLEVMSCKKNVVAYEYKGSREILYDENLCRLKNIDELSERILYYLRNQGENDKLAEKLYLKSKEFTVEKTLSNYHSQINQLLI